MGADDRAEVDDLYAAGDAEQLWRLLVVGPGGGALAPSVAVDLFGRHHSVGTAGAVDTALLLCTDWRWRRRSGAVLAGILALDVLGPADLDALAGRLLWPDRVRYAHRSGWLGTTFVEIELGNERTDRPWSRPRGRRVHLDPATPMHTPRTVWPPLRRWAATPVLVSQLAEPEAVVEHARSLPAADAAAVISGAVDAADRLPAQQAQAIVEVALGWAHKSARKAALDRLRAWGETERAHALAARDPDASLRRWAAGLDRSDHDTLF